MGPRVGSALFLTHPRFMKSSRLLFTAALTLACATLSHGQAPSAPRNKTKLELKGDDPAADPNLKLDPSAKLPAVEVPAESNATVDSPNAGGPLLMPQALQKLNQEQRDKYSELHGEVTNYMSSVRLQESLQKLSEMDALVGEPLVDIENLRGAVYTKMRDFAKAREHFQKAHELDKESFHPKFNLAEMDFVEKKYEPAISAFTALIAQNEALKKAAAAKHTEDIREAQTRQFTSTTQLMQFKLLICQAQLKNVTAAEEILNQYAPYDNDSPAYYFAKAALDYAADKKEEGDEWVASAKSIYPGNLLDVYMDSLVEMGWISTLGN